MNEIGEVIEALPRGPNRRQLKTVFNQFKQRLIDTDNYLPDKKLEDQIKNNLDMLNGMAGRLPEARIQIRSA